MIFIAPGEHTQLSALVLCRDGGGQGNSSTTRASIIAGARKVVRATKVARATKVVRTRKVARATNVEHEGEGDMVAR